MKNLKLILLSILTIVYGKSMLAQNLFTDSTYTYNENRQKEWNYIQKDVYCFKLKDEAKYSNYDNEAIDTVLYWSNVTSNFNEVHFNKNSSLSERKEVIDQIRNLADFEMESYALTKERNKRYDEHGFFQTDDRILITFQNKTIDEQTVSEFGNRYNLELIYKPSERLPKSLDWSYTFRIKSKSDLTTIKLAQILMEEEQNVIKLAEPNVYSVIPLNCITKSEMDPNLDGPFSTWHIHNEGQSEIYNNQNGTNGADANICECWGEGYTGKNVKVGVIDFGGVQFSHPDLDGNKVQNAYNARDNVIETNDFDLVEYTNPQQPLVDHAMQVIGTINAIPDNVNPNVLSTHQDSKRGIGSAYDAVVYPYINEWLTVGNHPQSSIDNVMRSLQKAYDDNVDIINMSFYVEIIENTLKTKIDNATNNGRLHPVTGAPLGIVCIAGTGNSDSGVSHFPANLDNVIGVGWSDPDDYRVSQNGSWSLFNNGSTYTPTTSSTPMYDVVAPGALIMVLSYTRNFSINHTSNSNNQWGSNYLSYGYGASIATPIVSSIAAMAIEKNYTLSYGAIRDYIRNGADKVRANNPYNYNFNGINGYSQEMFFGRVNCSQILAPIRPASLDIDVESLDNYIKVNSLENNIYEIELSQNRHIKEYKLFDMSGRLILSSNKHNTQPKTIINLNDYSKGLYVLKTIDNNHNLNSIKLLSK